MVTKRFVLPSMYSPLHTKWRRSTLKINRNRQRRRGEAPHLDETVILAPDRQVISRIAVPCVIK